MQSGQTGWQGWACGRHVLFMAVSSAGLGPSVERMSFLKAVFKKVTELVLSACDDCRNQPAPQQMKEVVWCAVGKEQIAGEVFVLLLQDLKLDWHSFMVIHRGQFLSNGSVIWKV